jgi:CDP-4-dehydro-6-deoxyglucose reductase
MKHKIHILPSAIEFMGTEDEPILESALNAGFSLKYSCNNGSCGECKAKVLKGDVAQEKNVDGLTDDEYSKGYILTCCANPQSSLALEATYYPELDGIKRVTLPCKIDTIDFPAPDIAVITLRLPPTTKFDYLPGQYIDLIHKGTRRSYSIANTQNSYDGIELHIRKVPEGVFSKLVFEDLKQDQLLRLEGPLGTFFLRDSVAPIIFLAGGTGFAPVKAMVESLLEEQSEREINIYWGSQDGAGLYSDIPCQLQDEYNNVRYIPVVSGADSHWQGRRGLIHKAVLDDYESLARFEIYACGSQAMIEAARKDFVDQGVKAESFYSDAFTPSY